MAITYKNPGTIEFDGIIGRNDGGGAFIAFPFDVYELYGVRTRVPVKVTFDGIPYQGSMVKMGPGDHLLLILKDIRERLGKDRGDTVHVTVELDDKPREVDMPDDFATALAQANLRDQFDAMAYTHRKEYAVWIASAKREETRTRRLEKAIEMIQDGLKLS